jgi:hypothetical protein
VPSKEERDDPRWDRCARKPHCIAHEYGLSFDKLSVDLYGLGEASGGCIK